MHIEIVPDDPRRRLVEVLGQFSVFYDPLPHRPYGLFRIYLGQRYVGAQLSRPNLSDCQWLNRASLNYADSSYQETRAYGVKAAVWRRTHKRAA